MSDTTSKREREDDSQSGAIEAADEDDDDLDAALFGDDGDDADESPADAVTAPLEEADDLPNAGVSGSVPIDQDVEIDDVEDDPIDDARQKLDERNKIIMGLMTEEQLDRYEAFRRSAINPGKIKRVLQTVSGQNVVDKMVTVMRGMTKVFVGELVEAACLIAHEQGESGPLQPAHYRAAYQQLYSQGKVPHKTVPKKLRI